MINSWNLHQRNGVAGIHLSLGRSLARVKIRNSGVQASRQDDSSPGESASVERASLVQVSQPSQIDRLSLRVLAMIAFGICSPWMTKQASQSCLTEAERGSALECHWKGACQREQRPLCHKSFIYKDLCKERTLDSWYFFEPCRNHACHGPCIKVQCLTSSGIQIWFDLRVQALTRMRSPIFPVPHLFRPWMWIKMSLEPWDNTLSKVN